MLQAVGQEATRRPAGFSLGDRGRSQSPVPGRRDEFPGRESRVGGISYTDTGPERGSNAQIFTLRRGRSLTSFSLHLLSGKGGSQRPPWRISFQLHWTVIFY